METSPQEVVDLHENKVEGSKKPHAEIFLHLLVYRNFPEVNSVLHVHSVNFTLISGLSKGDINLKDYELLKAFEGIYTHEASIQASVSENSRIE